MRSYLFLYLFTISLACCTSQVYHSNLGPEEPDFHEVDKKNGEYLLLSWFNYNSKYFSEKNISKSDFLNSYENLQEKEIRRIYLNSLIPGEDMAALRSCLIESEFFVFHCFFPIIKDLRPHSYNLVSEINRLIKKKGKENDLKNMDFSIMKYTPDEMIKDLEDFLFPSKLSASANGFYLSSLRGFKPEYFKNSLYTLISPKHAYLEFNKFGAKKIV